MTSSPPPPPPNTHSPTIAIILAIISLIGTLGVALIERSSNEPASKENSESVFPELDGWGELPTREPVFPELDGWEELPTREPVLPGFLRKTCPEDERFLGETTEECLDRLY